LHDYFGTEAKLRQYTKSWKAYFQLAEVTSPLRDSDKWIRRRLRCYHWKQWGQRGYRELRKRGVDANLPGIPASPPMGLGDSAEVRRCIAHCRINTLLNLDCQVCINE